MENLKLSLEHEGKLLRVTLNRPEKRNVFNADLIKELTYVFSGPACGNEEGYENVRVILLHGAGKSFCAGGDLNWMKASLDLSEEENFRDCKRLTKMFHLMDTCPKPVVGMIHGHAIGGGVGLACMCDHLIAETNTMFSLSEVKLGLVPACIGPFVIQKIGTSHARSLFVSGERFTGEKAQAIGLIHEHTSEDKLEERAMQVCRQIMTSGPHAVGVAKNLIHVLSREMQNENFDVALDFAARELARLRVGEEGQEGVKAFLEKREPSWRK